MQSFNIINRKICESHCMIGQLLQILVVRTITSKHRIRQKVRMNSMCIYFLYLRLWRGHLCSKINFSTHVVMYMCSNWQGKYTRHICNMIFLALWKINVHLLPKNRWHFILHTHTSARANKLSCIGPFLMESTPWMVAGCCCTHHFAPSSIFNALPRHKTRKTSFD